MKTGEKVQVADEKQSQTTPIASTLHESIIGMKESFILLSESLAEELNMSKSFLVTFKVGLLLQYFAVSLLLLSTASRAWFVNGNISCLGHSQQQINGTERSVIESLCRNPAYRDRFSALFLCLEIPVLLLLLLRVLVDERNHGWKFNWNLHFNFDDWTIYFITTLPRILVYIILPLQSALSTNASHSTLYAVFRSPFTFILGLLVRLIVFPIALFFPYPMKDFVEVNLSQIAESLSDLVPKIEQMSLTGKIDCFQLCQASFDGTWCFFVCFLLVNFSIVFWVLNIPILNEEPRRGESRAQYSDSVEFIRISEVSEDFSFEEDDCRVSATPEKAANDLIVAESCAIPSNVVHLDTGEIEDAKSITTEPDLDESVAVGSVGNESDKTVVSDINESVAVVPEPDDVKRSDFAAIKSSVILDSEEKNEELKEKVYLTKHTQTTIQHVSKGCQTFVPIHLYKKINKKTQVSPILVHAQTNTESDKKADTSVLKKAVKLVGEEQDRSEASELSETENVKNGVNSLETIHKHGKIFHVSEVKDSDAAEKTETKLIIGESCEKEDKSSGNGVSVIENGYSAKEGNTNGKFGYAELSLIPKTLDFEKRVIRENQIQRINVDEFLGHLKSEDDRDVIFVDKELLLNTFRDLVTVSKVKESEEAVCPKTNELLKKCVCSVHKLMKSLPVQDGQPTDEFDGLKMETEDDNYSDDESFFNGFRL
ncbi:uncharacterized protein LOC135680824 [Rhopilema esculentum]|uniref:uncharacterized protein LOC135680824 n=1 Tax=Rhopilema esculentum TaxID=499914 RepID=UPI0031DB52F2|eukprot:gene12728-3452_t